MNQIIIKIESGVVADVYFTEPVNVTIVDHDVIEGGETFEGRMKKAVSVHDPRSARQARGNRTGGQEAGARMQAARGQATAWANHDQC